MPIAVLLSFADAGGLVLLSIKRSKRLYAIGALVTGAAAARYLVVTRIAKP